MPLQSNRSLSLEPWHDGYMGGYDEPHMQGTTNLHFVHGNGLCSRVLEPVADNLMKLTDASAYRCLFTDLPGHGVSLRPKVFEPDWNLLADQMVASIQQRCDGPVVGIGHSLGSILMILAAAKYPDLFQRIVLLDPVIYNRKILIAQIFARRTGLWHSHPMVKSANRRRNNWKNATEMQQDLKAKSLYSTWHPESLDAFVRYGSRIHSAGHTELACSPEWEGQIFGSYPRRLWSSVVKITCPTLVVYGHKTYPFVPAAVARAQKLNSNISVELTDGTHCFPMEYPFETAQRIEQFINR
ncbi:MAG: alpha/beta hydrolase [Oleibacter sp.]|nr:alpha/beta hydrolase [Thalassolituus sp.]